MLSSAELTISMSFIIRKRSQMKSIKSKGLNREPWGTSKSISLNELYWL